MNRCPVGLTLEEEQHSPHPGAWPGGYCPFQRRCSGLRSQFGKARKRTSIAEKEKNSVTGIMIYVDIHS